MGDDRDQLARDLIGCFPVLDKSDRSAADAWPGPTELAEVERLRGELAKTISNFEEYAEANAERLADARHELDVLRGHVVDLDQRLDLALTDLGRALQERDEARAERDRRGDELRRVQAAIRAALDCHNEGDYDVCCGQATPCETVHALRDALEAPVPP